MHPMNAIQSEAMFRDCPASPGNGGAVHAAGMARLQHLSMHPGPVTSGGHDDVP
jgi:hypothetical protein